MTFALQQKNGFACMLRLLCRSRNEHMEHMSPPFHSYHSEYQLEIAAQSSSTIREQYTDAKESCAMDYTGRLVFGTVGIRSHHRGRGSEGCLLAAELAEVVASEIVGTTARRRKGRFDVERPPSKSKFLRDMHRRVKVAVVASRNRFTQLPVAPKSSTAFRPIPFG